MSAEIQAALQQLKERSQALELLSDTPERLQTELLDLCDQIAGLIMHLSGASDTPPALEGAPIRRLVHALEMAEAERVRHSRHLAALHRATTVLLETLDLEQLLGQILDAATGALPHASNANIYLIARDTGELELRASTTYQDPRIHRVSRTQFRNYVSKSVSEERPLLINRIEPSPEDGENAERAVIIAPLARAGKVLGALALAAYQPGVFEPPDLELLVSFAATATNAIYNAELHAEVQKLAVTDSLTGVYNRRGFLELGEREVARALRFRRPLSAIMLDIDDFKTINDSFGHTVGDQIICSVANLCRNNLRKIDLMGRYGGDEFVILLPETEQFAAWQVAERIRASQEAAYLPADGKMVHVSLSLGVANGTRSIGSLDALLKRADIAMLRAKQAGRNCIRTL